MIAGTYMHSSSAAVQERRQLGSEHQPSYTAQIYYDYCCRSCHTTSTTIEMQRPSCYSVITASVICHKHPPPPSPPILRLLKGLVSPSLHEVQQYVYVLRCSSYALVAQARQYSCILTTNVRKYKDL